MAWRWSWLLTVPQLFAYWQIGNKRRWAWLVAFDGDVFWVVYSLLSRQYGFTYLSHDGSWHEASGEELLP